MRRNTINRDGGAFSNTLNKKAHQELCDAASVFSAHNLWAALVNYVCLEVMERANAALCVCAL